MSLQELQPYVSPAAFATFQRADEWSSELLRRAGEYFRDLFRSARLEARDLCIAAMGSVGRREALAASDFDLLPVARDERTLRWLLEHDEALRDGLAARLGVDVSRSGSLTRAVALPSLTDPEAIGGEQDGRTGLAQRTLLLTEAAQAGGEMPIGQVRRAILEAYAHPSTAERHPLAFRHDLVRYYRTACVDHKGRVDTTPKDWCIRHAKLLHSRKMWYFASLVAIASASRGLGPDDAGADAGIAQCCALPPIQRLWGALGAEGRIAAAPMLDHYAWFLERMADPARREAFAQISYEDLDRAAGPAFTSLERNAQALHVEMLRVLDALPAEVRARVVDWFLL